jgi:hypothetical protein
MANTDQDEIGTRHLNELGDATEALQYLVDHDMPIPSGCYRLSGQVWQPDGYQDRAPRFASEGGASTFTRSENVQAACSACGNVRTWFAPNSTVLHRGVVLGCGRCDGATPHDEIPGRDLSPVRDADGSLDMDKIRVLRRGTRPAQATA